MKLNSSYAAERVSEPLININEGGGVVMLLHASYGL